MTARRGAFSFVDRITRFTPRAQARGVFTIPAGVAAWSPCLVAEAIGQLAAWVAMEDAQFERRPVAALAGEARFFAEAAAGSTLDLGVDIADCGRHTLAYDGWARANGQLVLELHRAVGPMLPMADFDDPRTVRAHFEALRQRELKPFDGAHTPNVGLLTVIDAVSGQRVHATLQAPQAAAFFADHFPRRSVFPATLLLDAQIRLALQLGGETIGARGTLGLRATTVRDVKVRSFVVPGQVLDLTAELQSASPTAVDVALTATSNGKRVSTARVELRE